MKMKIFLKLQKWLVPCGIMLFVVIFSSPAALAQTNKVGPGTTNTSFTVVHAVSANCKENNFKVIVNVLGAAKQGATVTLVKSDNNFYVSRDTDWFGSATFSFDLSAGPMYIIVTACGYKTYFGICKIICDVEPGDSPDSYNAVLKKNIYWDCRHWHWWYSYHVGGTIIWNKSPSTYLRNNEPHINIIINWEYYWRCPHWSLALEIGYNDFKRKELNDHFPWWNISPSLRYHFPLKRFKPFINTGPGLYIPREGEIRLGVKAGLGIDYQINDRLLFEMGTDYHHTFAKKTVTSFDGIKLAIDNKFAFQHFHVGFAYSLK